MADTHYSHQFYCSHLTALEEHQGFKVFHQSQLEEMRDLSLLVAVSEIIPSHSGHVP